MRYAARVTRCRNGRVAVQVPDVHGVIAYGDTEAAAIGHAQRILLLLIRQVMIDGFPVPLPSASGDVWIELPAEEVAAIEHYAANRPSRYGLRSLMSALSNARKRDFGEPAV
jgi:predicted RNase H-like HicB family nuclease